MGCVDGANGTAPPGGGTGISTAPVGSGTALLLPCDCFPSPLPRLLLLLLLLLLLVPEEVRMLSFCCQLSGSPPSTSIGGSGASRSSGRGTRSSERLGCLSRLSPELCLQKQ